MSKSTEQKQLAIRRRSFEAHVKDCEICKAPITMTPGGAKPEFCMAGSMMLSYFVREIKGPQPETEQQRLARIVEERAAAARYSFKHGLRENETDQSNLIGARFELARRMALDLNHSPLKQGISYECHRCGASGTFDVEAIGDIFTKQCATVATLAVKVAASMANSEEVTRRAQAAEGNDTLSTITLRRSTDTVKIDLEVVCTRCNEHLCDAEAGDSLAVLMQVATDHEPKCGTSC